MSTTSVVLSHYAKIWKVKGVRCRFSKGPVHELPAGFGVYRFPQHGQRQEWIYATAGMSAGNQENPIELHMISNVKSLNSVEILYITAHYHATGRALNEGHTVYFGMPWMANSICEYGLVSLPYLYGAKLEECILSTDKSAKCYWLIPITKSELEFSKKNGLDRLESEFERSGFDYADPYRASVV